MSVVSAGQWVWEHEGKGRRSTAAVVPTHQLNPPTQTHPHPCSHPQTLGGPLQAGGAAAHVREQLPQPATHRSSLPAHVCAAAAAAVVTQGCPSWMGTAGPSPTPASATPEPPRAAAPALLPSWHAENPQHGGSLQRAQCTALTRPVPATASGRLL